MPFGWSRAAPVMQPPEVTGDGEYKQSSHSDQLHLLKRIVTESDAFKSEDAAKEFFIHEQLKDYRKIADHKTHHEFLDFLQGRHSPHLGIDKAWGDEYTRLPFIPQQVDALSQDEKKKLASGDKFELFEERTTQRIPFKDKSLVNLPGVHAYLKAEMDKEFAFRFYLSKLYAFGPKSLEEAWDYFRYIVKKKDIQKVDIEQWYHHNHDPDDETDLNAEGGEVDRDQ